MSNYPPKQKHDFLELEEEYQRPIREERVATSDAAAAMKSIGVALRSVVHLASYATAVKPMCDESPIEWQLGAHLARTLEFECNAQGFGFALCQQGREVGLDVDYFLVPQYQWKGKRFDFAITQKRDLVPLMFIECDGKDFHSTPEQIANDKIKNDMAVHDNIIMQRFTGSQIYKRSSDCARLIVRQLMHRGRS